ncbi:DUF6011 domain-containing protein [Streptomyces sp. ATexAB-D23]|uniref:DUF6011 domain-containing protein n=1 Tax=unclassified Streptomyces TaxID=2593676 RepID=UPI0003794D29|nr:DUF6011 domain-containing protein [Streptomyces sp. ATexAB-D23]MYY03037.1 hypothetical protein [Streptomyces sp. SID4913]
MESPEAAPATEPLPGTATATGPRTVRCRLCGRPLTGTASRRTGLGPSCDAKLHPAPPAIRHRRHEVEQDVLPGT